MTQGQTPAFRSYDGPFSYTAPTGHEGCCYLQVFERRGALPVVLYIICNHRLSDAMYVRRRPLFSRGAGRGRAADRRAGEPAGREQLVARMMHGVQVRVSA